jgi:hypothetical protein
MVPKAHQTVLDLMAQGWVLRVTQGRKTICLLSAPDQPFKQVSPKTFAELRNQKLITTPREFQIPTYQWYLTEAGKELAKGQKQLP